MEEKTGIKVSQSTMYRFLLKNGLTRKKKSLRIGTRKRRYGSSGHSMLFIRQLFPKAMYAGASSLSIPS